MAALHLNVPENEARAAVQRQRSPWRACYVFVEPGEPVETLLVEIVRSLRKLAPAHASWFFIRYAEDGQHLRIRVRNFSDAAFERLVDRIGELATAQLKRAVRLTQPDYEPEVQRYGGVIAVLENEALFELSSELAMRIVMANAQPVFRINHALDLMLAVPIALALSPNALSRFFRGYAASWRSIFGEHAGAIGVGDLVLSSEALRLRFGALASSGNETATPATLWCRALVRSVARFREIAAAGALISPFDGARVRTVDEEDRAIASMLTSQMHMMNNRLGLVPIQEYHLSASIGNAFDL
jgi:hypothetical protein